MEQSVTYINALGGFAGIAAILAVIVSHFKNKQSGQIETLVAESKSNSEAFRAQIQALQAQIQALQASSESNTAAFRAQIQAVQESFDRQLNSWKDLWEASKLEIRELKMEIKELRSENDKLRTEIVELKGQLKEHYKLA